MAEMTIVTYGGGEVLFKVFTAIKMLFDSNTIKILAYLMAAITSLSVIFTSYFSSSSEGLIKNFLLPILVLTIFCFSVKTTVSIEDKLSLNQGGINPISNEAFEPNNQNVTHEVMSSWDVEGVPFVVGFIAKGISSIGYKLTSAVENVFHTVDDDKYTKTGMIFGAETALDMNEIIINDGNLDSNLRTFCKTCMLYDLALGFYTVQDIKNENCLLNFLKENTAKSRYMNYVSSSKESGNNSELISCKEAIDKISEKLGKGGHEVHHQQKKQIFKHLPIAYQALTKQSGDSAEMIQQLLVGSVIADEISSEAFASKRAALQQKTIWKTTGGFADSTVTTTRSVIEALVYASIIFVIPLMFLPSGYSYLKNWVWLLVWIQLWPPFYVILDYISLIALRGQAEGLFDSENAGTCCLTIYNTIGLSNVYGNISAYAKSMKILIPPISYAILQGGVGSFVHMTSSMMGATQQAASMAASDQVSGNYGFANTNMNTGGFANTSYGQQNYGSSLTSGYLRQDNVRGSTMYSSNDSTVQENMSRFSFGVSEDKAIQSSLTSTLSSSTTAHEASTSSLNSSISNAARSAKDYTSHLAHDSSYSIAGSASESQDYSKSAQFCESQIDSFARDHNISNQAAWEIFGSVGAKLPFDSVSAGLSARYGLISNDTYNDAMSVSESQDFREAYNQVQNHAVNNSHNETDGEGYRLANSFTSSTDQMKSASESYSATLDKLNQASETANFYNAHNFTERQDLSQKMLDYAVEDRGYSVNDFKDLIHNENRSEELIEVISGFSSTRLPAELSPQNYVEPVDSHDSSIQRSSGFTSEVNEEFVMQESKEFSGSIKEQVRSKLQNTPDYSEKIELTKEEIQTARESIIQKNETLSKVSSRNLELEIDWSGSFDDDLMPMYHRYR